MTYVTPAPPPSQPPPSPRPFLAVTLSHAAVRRGVWVDTCISHPPCWAAQLAGRPQPLFNGRRRMSRLIDANGRRGFAVSDGCSAADTAEDWTQIISKGGGGRRELRAQQQQQQRPSVPLLKIQSGRGN